jgi:hypothetical protein
VVSIADEQIRLGDLNIFSNEQLKELSNYNILTAEQFVGTCATPEGFKGISRVLNVPPPILQKILQNLLEQVKSQLPTELAKLLSEPVAFTPPLGARKPNKTKKRGGKKNQT